jgi:hypothetical protein
MNGLLGCRVLIEIPKIQGSKHRLNNLSPRGMPLQWIRSINIL